METLVKVQTQPEIRARTHAARKLASKRMLGFVLTCTGRPGIHG
jgi:hypothetical protein